MPASTTSNDPQEMDVDVDADDSSSLSSLSEHEELDVPKSKAKTSKKDASKLKKTNGAPPPEPAPTTPDYRRRSTRVVKRPAPYSEPPSTARRAKRKRPEEDEGNDSDTADGEEEGEDEDDASSNTVQGDDDNEEDSEEVASSESESEEESEGEPDEEELKEQRRRGKRVALRGKGRGGRGARAASGTPRPAAKKAKTISGELSARAEPRKKTTATKKGKEKATNGGDVPPMANDIYDAVFVNHNNYDDVAVDWIMKYQEDIPEAMKKMVNFILKCCGCEHEVTNYDIEDQDSAAATLSQIQQEFQKQQLADYPLTSKKAAFRRFRQGLKTFFSSFINMLYEKELLIADPGLMENVQIWIAAMSSSTLRQFRHTSTIIALDIVSELSEVAARIRKANGTTNRQLEAEDNKTTKNAARETALRAKLTEGEARGDAVESIIKDIVDTVFVHRYRDIDPKIRSDCIHELGNWILVLPDVFFDGSYLRYLGWILSDTTPTARLEVIRSLTKLFKKKDSVSGLRHFTERFRERLVEMGTRDADSSVRVATVELLDVIREVGYLEPEDIQTVCRLLFDSEQKVRRAVVNFFVEYINDLYEKKLEELGEKDEVLEALEDDDEEEPNGPTLSWIKLKSLAEVLVAFDEEGIDSEGESLDRAILAQKNLGMVRKVGDVVSRFSLAGAVLWDALDEVRDWEGLAQYLLYDHSAGKTAESVAEGEEEEEELIEQKAKKLVALDAKEDVILLHILNASVAGTIYKGPDKKKGQPARTLKEIEKHKEHVSRNLMQYIPLLLKKFGPAPDAASAVLRLEQLMNLDVFQELRQSSAYSSLLDEINRQFLTHADENVLKEASAALMHAISFEELSESTESKLNQLKEETLNVLVNCVRGKDIEKVKFSEAMITELINTVRRLEYIAGIADCVEMLEIKPSKNTEIPINILLGLTKRGVKDNELEEELVIRAMRTISFYFMWKTKSFNDNKDVVTETDVEELINRRAKTIELISSILDSRVKVDPVKKAAAGAVLDLTTLFVSCEIPRVASLCTMLEAPLQKHVMEVLDDVEKSYAKASDKTLEVDENADPVDDDEDEASQEEYSPTDILVLEHQLCEFTAKIVLAILARALDAKSWRKRLSRNQSRLGPNYREVVNHLDKKPPGQPKKQTTVVRAPNPAHKSAEIVEDEDEDNDNQGHEGDGAEEVAEEEEDGDGESEGDSEGEQNEEEEHHDELEEEDVHDESDKESEPDPEVEVSPDGDEDTEMVDA